MNTRLVAPIRWLMTAVVIVGLLGFATAPARPGQAASQAQGPIPQAVAGQTCVLLQPSPSAGIDAYIKQEKQDEKRGGDPELRVKTESGKLMRSLLKFDLSSIPSTAIINSAALSLYVKGASGGPVTINAHRITASWNEAEVTWKARDKAASLLWASLGGDYDASVAASTSVDDTKNVWRAWNLTSLASGWLTTPASNYGVILESPVTNPKTEKIFKSSDDGTASQRPKLEVCYTAGVSLEPNNSGDGVAGQTRTYAHVVHIGNVTTVVNLSAASSQGWTARIYKDVDGDGIKDPEDTLISATPSLGPGADYPILVQVDVPGGTPVGVTDTTTVTATAVATGGSDTATDTTRVGSLLVVEPDFSQYATVGSVLFYGHTVTNNGQTQDCVIIGAVSSQGWTVLLWEDTNHNGVHEISNPNEPALSNPVCIDPGKTYYLVAEVRVPAGASEGAVDHTVITATSGNEPSKSDSATDTTTVFVNNPPVIDGKYDDAYRKSPYASEVCYNANGVLFGKLATYYQPTSSAVYMVLAIDKDFVDNTYGVNAVNWPSGHDFGNLVGSDHAQFQGYDGNGTLVLDIKQDYITAASVTPSTPSGYDSLGVTGGEGQVNLGSAAHILQWATSFDYDLNSLGYCSGGTCSSGGTNLLVDSPATDDFYTPNPTYPAWIYDVIYELKFDIAAFGADGFGSLDVPYIHASPSKLGTNTIYAEPGVCPGEIGDFVWYDTNHNGVQDAGEAGINGVQVKLYRDNGDGIFNAATDTVVATQSTSSGGKYLFQNLVPDDYFVDVVNATVPAGYIITTHNDPTEIIHLGAGQNYLEADFGYTQPYADLQVTKTLNTADPIYAGQEISFTIRITNTGSTIINTLPLRDWYDPSTLHLLGATPASDDNTDDGALNWSDLTAAQSFDRDLRPGESFAVIVRFTATKATKSALLAAAFAPAAVQTEPVVDGRLDSNYVFAARFDPPAVDTPANLYKYAGANACYWALVTDRGFNDNVYADRDLDNAYMTLDGWTVKHDFSALRNSDHAIFDITYTGGAYNDLTLDYLAGSPGAWSSGQTGQDQSAAPGTGPVNSVMTSLHGNLLSSNWNGGTWGDPLKHSPAYDYNYTSGNYWEWSIIYEFSIPKSKMGGACGTATLVSAHNSPAKQQSGTAQIGDRVWNDLDGDKAQDTGEPGLPNITLNLYQGSTLVRTTQTEPGTTGHYIFNNLAAGTYRVDVVEASLPPTYQLTTANEPMTVTVASGGSVLTADFGYWLAGKGSIGDRVFYDLNGDGLPDTDGEPGINGVTVQLYQGSSCTGTPKATAVTAGNGGYSFTSLLAGTYCVNVDASTLPAGYSLTTGNVPLIVTLADSQNYTDADFGYWAQCTDGTVNLALVSGAVDDTGTSLKDFQGYACAEIQNGGRIGDLVWNDANGNGVRDYYTPTVGLPQLEPAIGGAVVALTLPGGSVITQTTTITGYYQFTGLGPGQYAADVIQVPAGYFATTNNHPQTVNLAAGQAFEDADFGYAGKASLSGIVFYDWNSDGDQGVGEDGIPNVPVCLYRDNDRDGALDDPGDTWIPPCQNTAADGGYSFTGLLPGWYLIVETQPAGLQNTTDNVIPRTLVFVGPGPLSADNNYGEILYVKLGDFVYLDFNADGDQDPGENTGLTGVPLHVSGKNVLDQLVDTTINTVNGSYLDQGLLPGTYTVTAPSTFSGFHLTSPSAQTTTLGIAKTEDLNLDFGYVYPTGVGVQQFGAMAGRGLVELSWLAFGEPAPAFNVWRAENGKGVGAVKVNAESLAGATGAYRFTDASVTVGQTYWYWLEEAVSGQRFGPQSVTVRPMVIGAYMPLIGR